MTKGWDKGCGVTKEEYEHNCVEWHFGRWCMARGVLRDQTNVMTWKEALKIDREEARYFANLLKIDDRCACFV